MADRNRYEVKIGDDFYTLKTLHTKEETDVIVNYVNQEMSQARSQLNYRNPVMHATLACLNIADDLFNTKDELNKLTEEAKIPMAQFEPLSRRFEHAEYELKRANQEINDLKESLASQKQALEKAEHDKRQAQESLDNYLKTQKDSKSEIAYLRQKLIEQEKETLQAYKQLQEAQKHRDNK